MTPGHFARHTERHEAAGAKIVGRDARMLRAVSDLLEMGSERDAHVARHDPVQRVRVLVARRAETRLVCIAVEGRWPQLAGIALGARDAALACQLGGDR